MTAGDLEQDHRAKAARFTRVVDPVLREAIQAIADGVCEIAGFGVAAASVMLESDEFEIVAVSSEDPTVRELIGKRNPRAAIDAELGRGEDWGRFKYVPIEAQAQLAPHTWESDHVYPDEDGAWDSQDILVAPLYNGDEIIGMLSVDLPDDGRIPDAGRRHMLNSYAGQAERALLRALERQRIDERLRLADAARTIVRTASVRANPDEILALARDTVLNGFRADGLSMHLFPDDDHDEGEVTTFAGVRPPATTDHLEMGERIARALWRDQKVGVFALSLPSTYGAEATAVASTFLTNVGSRSVLYVPLGVGDRCLGGLALTRDGHDEWTEDERATALDLGRDLGQAILNAYLFRRDQQLVTRLREVDEHRSRLIATIAHEFKNPLTAIGGNAELLGEQIEDPELRRWVAVIDRASTRLTNLVQNLLVLGRVTDPRIEPADAVVDLARFLDPALEMFGTQARERRITVVVERPDGPVPVRATGGDVDLVVSNLVSNAIKYGHDDGHVRIVVSIEGDHACLAVTDDGLGISAADQHRLFEEFFRSNNTAVSDRPGTGLGLTIVARVVQRLNGFISVDSTLGEGTTFLVRLPLATA